MVSMFKCPEREAPKHYAYLAKIHHLDKYQVLYSLMRQIWDLLPFDENNFKDETMFKYADLICCVDKIDGSYCEILGTGFLSIPARIRLHQKKIKHLKKDIIQWTLF